jgi:hypothetical protein
MAYLDGVTRLGLGGGPRAPYPAFGAAAIVAVVEEAKGGRRKRKRRFSIEIDDELFVVDTVAEALDILRMAKQVAKTEPLPAKRPSIRVIGDAPKTARLEAERAQRVVSRAFSKQLDNEIGRLLRESAKRSSANEAAIRRGLVDSEKREQEAELARLARKRDEEAIIALLLAA